MSPHRAPAGNPSLFTVCNVHRHNTVNSNFILHTYRHMWRHRRHLHQNSFWSAGGLSCRKLSNKGINKAWTKCSSSKVTGSGCTPKEARPSADLCQWSHHVQPNTLLKSAGTDIATKNLQEKQGSKRNHEKAAFLQLKEKKKNPFWRIYPIPQLQQCEISKGKPDSPFLIQNLFAWCQSLSTQIDSLSLLVLRPQ